MSTSSTVYVVSGASRGIGYKFIEDLSARQNTIVFAGVRSLPLAEDSQLAKLAARLPEVVFPIQLNSGNVEDNKAAAKVVSDKVGKVDVVIANAGVASGLAYMKSVTAEQIHGDFDVNVLGPVVLYQSFADLLAKSAAPDDAKFVVISSLIGQVTNALPYPVNAYGISKAAVNFVVKKIDMEDEKVAAFPVHPGLVRTDMGNSGADVFGMSLDEMGAITTQESVSSLLAVIDKATKTSHGGKFWNYTGEQLVY